MPSPIVFGGTTLLSLALLFGIAWIARGRWIGRIVKALARVLGPHAMAWCGIAGFLVTMCVGMFVHMPQPRIHDEYSYLLAADTFAHFRLTNHTHPLWHHFETIHEIQHPSYASKYPPGQGMALALGQLLGNPAVGLWITAGFACASVCWMLQAFYPRRWALLGGMLAAIHPMVVKWTQNYWGGLVAMIGGVLLIGAVRRLADGSPRRRDAVALAIGILILLNSRPWEGALFTVIALAKLWDCWRWSRGVDTRDSSADTPRGAFARHILRKAAPAIAVLVAGVGWMGYYNWRVTGNALRMPYMEHEAQYWVAPTLMFLPERPVPPTLTAPSMRGVALTWAVPSYRRQHTLRGFLDSSAHKLLMNFKGALLLFDMSVDDLDPVSKLPVWLTGLCWILLIPLGAAVYRIRRDPWLRWSVGAAAGFSVLLLTDTWMHPHYAAPAAGLVAVILVGGLRTLSTWSIGGRPVGRNLTRALALCVAGSLIAACAQFRSPEWVRGNGSAREVVIAYLHRESPRNLVIVRYGKGYQVNGEWLYNAADIDNSPIVWARELDPASNSRLLHYFRDRRPWLLLLDQSGAHLYPIGVTKM